MGQMTVQEFWTDLVRTVPEFGDAYRRELEEEEGELLPHLMMGITLRPFLEARIDASSPPKTARDRIALDVAQRAVACLEAGLAAGDHELQETILISFLQKLATERSEDTQHRFRAFFGPYLESGMKAVERWLAQPWQKDRSAPYEWLTWDPSYVQDQAKEAQ